MGIQSAHFLRSFTYSSSNVSSLRFNLVNFQKKIASISMPFAGNGQAAKDCFSTKFHSLPWWFTYDDDCNCMQKSRLKFCRFLSSLFCPTLRGFMWKENNWAFSATGVHDSYWTHACDVDELNRTLREKFVELYETPILEKVSISTTGKVENIILSIPVFLFTYESTLLILNKNVRRHSNVLKKN